MVKQVMVAWVMASVASVTMGGCVVRARPAVVVRPAPVVVARPAPVVVVRPVQ